MAGWHGWSLMADKDAGRPGKLCAGAGAPPQGAALAHHPDVPSLPRTALVEGKPLPVLCTLSRDGALLTWTFTPAADAAHRARKSALKAKAGAGAGAAGEDAAGDGYQLGAAGGAVVVEGTGPKPKRQRLADGRAAADAEAQAKAAAEAVAQGAEEGPGDDDPAVMPFLAGGWLARVMRVRLLGGLMLLWEGPSLAVYCFAWMGAHRSAPMSPRPACRPGPDPTLRTVSNPHTGGKWSLAAKDYLHARGARVSCAAFHKGSGLLVVGTTTGLFDMYQLPGFENLQVRGAHVEGPFGGLGDARCLMAWFGRSLAAVRQRSSQAVRGPEACWRTVPFLPPNLHRR